MQLQNAQAVCRNRSESNFVSRKCIAYWIFLKTIPIIFINHVVTTMQMSLPWPKNHEYKDEVEAYVYSNIIA